MTKQISHLKSYNRIIEDLKKRVEIFNGDSIKKVWNDLDKDVIQQSLV